MQTDTSYKPYGYIYKITNPINNKCYIGQTTQRISSRWHRYKKLKCKGQPKLYNALLKYGSNNFIYEIFDDSATNQDELDFLEKSYIYCFNSIEYGYNDKEGGSNGKHTNETKQKLSAINTGKKLSVNTKEKISFGNKNKFISDYTKLQMSLAAKKRWESASGKLEKQKRSEDFSGAKNPRYGKISKYKNIPRNIKIRQKISDSLKRYQLTLNVLADGALDA